MKTYRQKYAPLLNETLLVAFEEILSDSAADILSLFVPCEVDIFSETFMNSGYGVKNRKAFSEKNIIEAF
jgi:hypothetical protein